MKKYLLVLALAVASTSALADKRHPTGGTGLEIGLVGGNATVNGGDQRRQIPGAGIGLGGGGTNTTAWFRYMEQDSHAFLWGTYAQTKVRSHLSVVSFIHGTAKFDGATKDRLELAACIESQDFRTLRHLEGNECPAISSTPAKPLGQ